MNGAPEHDALRRIEAAIARIETAVSGEFASEDVRARHQALRATVAHTLRDLDDLLTGSAPLALPSRTAADA